MFHPWGQASFGFKEFTDIDVDSIGRLFYHLMAYSKSEKK
jgi:hypothetical protein